MIYDMIVIGAGTAGMTAALNALRNGKTVLVLEKETVGGQISFSPRVENFPTIMAISGAELSDRLFEQIMSHGADFELEKVTGVEKNGDIFTVTTEYGAHEGRTVIIATGASPRRIGVEGENELVGHGVSYCALCDGAFYKDEEVALIGDANTALQYALFLTGYCKKVHVCTLFDRFFADKAHVDNLMTKDNVAVYHNLSLREFLSENGELTGLVFENTTDKSEFRLPVKAVFIAIGQVPDNKAFANLCDIDKNGYVIAGDDGKTRTDGLFVAGDCRTKSVRQLATAAADGAIAATNASLYLK
ncbi:MAG: FAD-dependent oxidoreductase [Eubacteriales bacterium]|nr:FAD-dependent oxidoreductase [Christensenellaceae bacterium]MDY2750888.1 FAD-dependent oxidoreductase [Eubacteriales bacterium]MCI7769905.1 FAD-dependent oxidoreductase [Christensenellaceae bacterium]MDD6360459.1 FAD-dependent oxidoreductase [Christensenellaceae bacterium]MDD7245356.1 FAD-dependent oxidoreductase [Christensenellaceae bacterium]